MMRALRWLPAAWLAISCAAPKPGRVPLEVSVVDQDGQPIAEVAAWSDGQRLGQTSAAGTLSTLLAGDPGSVRTVQATCPAGYDASDATRRIHLPQEAAKPTALRLGLTCRAVVRTLAVVVRVEGPSVAELPLRVDGEVRGHTDRNGVAHLLVQRSPGSELNLTLDTSAHPQLRPQHPVAVLRVGDGDGYAVVERGFEVERQRRRRPRSAPGTPAPQRPYRIR